MECVDVGAVLEFCDDCPAGVGGVFESVFFADCEGVLAHPDEHCFDVLPDFGAVVWSAEHISA